jgi:hypothetical protein
MTMQSLELLLAVIAVYTLGFLWFALPEPEFETIDDI